MIITVWAEDKRIYDSEITTLQSFASTIHALEKQFHKVDIKFVRDDHNHFEFTGQVKANVPRIN